MPAPNPPRRPAAPPPGPAAVVPAPVAMPREAYRGGVHDAAGQTGVSRVPRLSVRRYEYDPLRAYRLCFGKEPDVDEHSGRMVHPHAAPRP